jgi:hypothetical protein
MFMEDVISRLASVEFMFSGRDRKFIRSIGRRVEKGDALTTRQGWALLSIMRNNRLNSDIGMKKDAYDALLTNPQWRTPLVPSVELRSEVRHLGDNILGFRTSNGKTEAEFSAMNAVYSNGMKILSINNTAHLSAVVDFIGKWGFQIDNATEQFLAQCMEHAETKSRAVVDGESLLVDCPNDHVLAQFTLHVLGARFL